VQQQGAGAGRAGGGGAPLLAILEVNNLT